MSRRNLHTHGVQSACSGSDDSDATTTDTGDRGILDYDCIAATQQMLPWGSQYRNIVSREGHTWVLASLDRDPQVAAAALAAENAARLEDATDAARRHFLHRFFVFLSSCRLSRHPRARAPCGAASCHVMQGGDRDLDRHHDDCGGPSNEREL